MTRRPGSSSMSVQGRLYSQAQGFRPWPLKTLLTLSFTATVLVGTTRAQAPTFRASSDVVTVGVSVQQNGRPVGDLEVGDFTITDNGVPQTIRSFDYERLPVDMTVVFDVSESVAGNAMEQLRRALADLRKSLRSNDRLRLVTFNMRVRRVFDFTAPPAEADAALRALVPGGSSAVFDAVAAALAWGGAEDRRQFIVLFSDGKDSVSITTPAALLGVARRTTPTVSVVLASPARTSADSVFNDLAAETGGVVISLLPTETIGGHLRRVLDQFRSSYLLAYAPTGVPAEGSHAIEVRVNRPGVEVRARRGYVVR